MHLYFVNVYFKAFVSEPKSVGLPPFLSLFLNFLKYKFIYFNWRLITLQNCIGFAIHQHESATCIHVFPILNHHLPPRTIPLGCPGAPDLEALIVPWQTGTSGCRLWKKHLTHVYLWFSSLRATERTSSVHSCTDNISSNRIVSFLGDYLTYWG